MEIKCEECRKNIATKQVTFECCAFCGGTQCSDYGETIYLCEFCAKEWSKATDIKE